jgi:hypothetical protein
MLLFSVGTVFSNSVFEMKSCITFGSLSEQKWFVKRHVKFQLRRERPGQVSILKEGEGHVKYKFLENV